MTDPERSVDPDPMEIAPGTHVAGKYTVLAPLGGGAMGSVYVAKHVVTGGRVALKVLRGEASRTAAHLERFEREAAIAAQVGHPGIVKVLDAGLDSRTGRLWLAMELLDGDTLAERMRRPEITRLALLRAARGLLDALAAAHDAGFVHRDLKPENVFVTAPSAEAPSRVVLLDFGIARPIGVKTATQTGIAVGTPAYMSPEQALRPSTIGVRADVWSFGAMLYEIVAGAPPFDGESPHAIVLAATAEPHVPLTRTCPWVPPALSRLVDRCLAKDAAKRPDARELASALDQILADPASVSALERASVRADAGGAPTQSGTMAVPLVSARPGAGASGGDEDASGARRGRRSDAWIAVAVGGALLVLAIGAVILGRAEVGQRAAAAESEAEAGAEAESEAEAETEAESEAEAIPESGSEPAAEAEAVADVGGEAAEPEAAALADSGGVADSDAEPRAIAARRARARAARSASIDVRSDAVASADTPAEDTSRERTTPDARVVTRSPASVPAAPRPTSATTSATTTARPATTPRATTRSAPPPRTSSPPAAPTPPFSF